MFGVFFLRFLPENADCPNNPHSQLTNKYLIVISLHSPTAVEMELPDAWKSAKESLVKFVLTLSNIIINKQDISL